MDLMMKKWLLMLCFVCIGAHAEDWRTVGNSDTSELTVDVDSIKDNGGIREAWSMWNFSQARATNDKDFPSLKSYKDLQQYNCKDKSVKLTREIIYADLDGGGDKRDHSDALKNMQFVKTTPGTVADIMLQKVCSYEIKK
jgi:hypothetical protein